MEHILKPLYDFQNLIIMTANKVNTNPLVQIFEFKPMTEFPKVNHEASDMSVIVLLYDKDDINNVFVGFYAFALEKWLAFGNDEDVTDFSCWCYPPSPNLYLQVEGRANRKGKIDAVINDTEEPTSKKFSDFFKEPEPNSLSMLSCLADIQMGKTAYDYVNNIRAKVPDTRNLEPKEGFNNRHLTPLPKEKCIIEVFMNESRNERVDLCEWTPFDINNYFERQLPSEGYIGNARIITGKYKGIGYHAWMQNNYEFIYWRHIQGNATFSSEIGSNPNHSLS